MIFKKLNRESNLKIQESLHINPWQVYYRSIEGDIKYINMFNMLCKLIHTMNY